MWNIENKCNECQVTDYCNPNFKLYYPPCNHSLCKVCRNKWYKQFTIRNCPECHKPWKKADYKDMTPEEYNYNREIKFRKTLSEIFNVQRKIDNPSSEDYNDYMEMIEDKLIEMMNDTLKEEEITDYKKKNQDAIATNKAILENEKKRLRSVIVHEETLLNSNSLPEMEDTTQPGSEIIKSGTSEDYIIEANYIFSIYSKFAPALQLPALPNHQDFASERLEIYRGGGYSLDYVKARAKKEFMDSLHI